MPKMKTHSGAKKRFGVSRTGKVKSRAAHKRHRLVSKSKRMKREGRGGIILREMDGNVILDNFLPYERKKKRNNRNRQRPVTDTATNKEAA